MNFESSFFWSNMVKDLLWNFEWLFWITKITSCSIKIRHQLNEDVETYVWRSIKLFQKDESEIIKSINAIFSKRRDVFNLFEIDFCQKGVEITSEIWLWMIEVSLKFFELGWSLSFAGLSTHPRGDSENPII